MPEGAEKMGEQFSGLNMESLIGGPLKAAYDAQAMLAASTAKFIENVGFEAPGTDGTGRVRTETFSFKRGVASENGEGVGTEEVSLKVPLLSIVKIPALGIDEVDIKFDMEVKSSESLEKSSDESGELDANAGLKVGPFHMDVKIKGSISSHKKKNGADNTDKDTEQQ